MRNFCISILLLVLLCATSGYAQNWQSLDSLSRLFYYAAKYDSALTYAEKALTRAEKEFQRNDARFDTALCRLAQITKVKKNYTQTLAYYEEIIRLRIFKLEEKFPDFASGMYYTVQMYRSVFEKEKAVPMYEKAIELISSIDTVDYSVYYNLSMIYTESFMPHDQDTIDIQYLRDQKEKFGPVSPGYLAALDSITSKYKMYGKYRPAIPLFEEAIELSRKLKKGNSPEFATRLANLAFCSFLTVKYKKALPLYEEATKIWKANKVTNSPDYGNALFYQGCIYMMNRDYAKSLPIFEDGVKVIKAASGTKDPYYSVCLMYVGMIYLLQGDLPTAEKYYKDYYDVLYNPADTNNASLMGALIGLGYIYEKTNRLTKAEPVYIEANNLTFNQIRNLFQMFYFAPEKKIAQFFSGFSYSLDSYYSFFFKRYKENNTVAGYMYNDELIKKGLVLRAMKYRVSSILNSRDTSLINKFDRWIILRQQLSKLYLIPIAERKADVMTMEKEIQELENNINSDMYKYTSTSPKQELLKWEQIRNNLKPDEAAVEFLTFNAFTYYENMEDTAVYCALVVRPGFKNPKMVYLFSEREFEKFLKINRRANSFNSVKQLYSYDKAGDTLYNYIWRPIDSLLQGAKKVFFSPSGLLHKISFPAIPVQDSTLLIDKYELQQVSSTGNVATKREPFTISKDYEALLYGGILYDLDTVTFENSSRKYRSKNEELFNRDRSFRFADMQRGTMTWPYLEGTLAEAQQIKSLFDDNSITTRLESGADAVEESFKVQTIKSPEIIHIATHGFFFPEKKPKKKNRFMADSNQGSNVDYSLVRSGLIFAGGNGIFQGLPPVPGAEDGVLTAYEVSNLNLSNTKLVVLSACETGLGEIKGSEGVYGLQRAFKLAGVEYIIMSLWQIPDEQTVELMNLFYKNWLRGTDIHEAFRSAQHEMRKKYGPFYWAAFVLVE